MSQPTDLAQLPYKDRIALAIKATNGLQNYSERHAAKLYDVSRRTLRRRRVGTTSRRDTQPNSSRLTKSEEEAIIQYIKKQDTRGFAPTLSYVADMANQLLAARGEKPVGPKWASTFVSRKHELKAQLTRQRNWQRVMCSDIGVISPWFDRVQNAKAKYGILDEDTYNFDETGFTMDIGNRVKVVTASERRTQPIGVQQGDREWVTFIAAVNALGRAISPYFVFKAKNHDAIWYPDLKPGWRIGVSENG